MTEKGGCTQVRSIYKEEKELSENILKLFAPLMRQEREKKTHVSVGRGMRTGGTLCMTENWTGTEKSQENMRLNNLICKEDEIRKERTSGANEISRPRD